MSRMLDPTKIRPDAIGVIDVSEDSKSYGRMVGRADMPKVDDELHHFGWNACSSCLCPYAPHPHMERQYLAVPGLRSSRIHILDTKPDPRNPKLVKVIEPETVMARSGYSRPHTVHCGPEGIYMNALGSPDGSGPGVLLGHADLRHTLVYLHLSRIHLHSAASPLDTLQLADSSLARRSRKLLPHESANG
jgi:hypothetical protein